MRKHAGSWMIKIILFVIVIVFIFWGVGSVKSRRANRVAEVNGEVITVSEYKDVYENLKNQYRRVYGSNLTEELLRMLNLRQQALWRLIDRKLMLQQARKMGLQVTDAELAASIQSIKAFQTNGVFDSNRYQRLLARARMTPEAFEIDQRQSLILSRLQNILLAGVTVSDGELRSYYDWLKAEVDIQYVLFSILLSFIDFFSLEEVELASCLSEPNWQEFHLCESTLYSEQSFALVIVGNVIKMVITVSIVNVLIAFIYFFPFF